jgi:hypothetical protein
MRKPICRRLSLILGWIVISHLTLARAEDPAADYAKIREGMGKLVPFGREWSAVALFHDGDKVRENDGTWEIRLALEDTYLEYRVAGDATGKRQTGCLWKNFSQVNRDKPKAPSVGLARKPLTRLRRSSRVTADQP